VPDAGTSDDLIARLVSIHGEEGICPTEHDWRTIFAVGAGRPVELVNLLAFAPQVDTQEASISGAEAYSRYTSGISKAFARAGGELVFFGHVRHMFSFGGGDAWDAVIVTRYPSPAALAEMWLDPEFIAAHANRLDGVARSQALVFGP
jgi:uncharacterized protein (DUF1330 family)